MDTSLPKTKVVTSTKARPVIAFERGETFVFPSIYDAALAYGVDRKLLWNRIQDGSLLPDGYTTVDYLFTGEKEGVI